MADDALWPSEDMAVKARVRALMAEGISEAEIKRRLPIEFDWSPEEADRWIHDPIELIANPAFCPAPLSEYDDDGMTEITFGKWIPGSRRTPDV